VPEFCLVVPCYNEDARLDVAAFHRFLNATPTGSLCLVNDGSTDGTLAVLQGMANASPGRVLVVDLKANAGKAEAVRQGMRKACSWKPFRYVGYWDADLATPFEEASAMLRAAEARPGCLMVLGLRLNRLGASVNRSPLRHYPGRVFATCASLVLGLAVYDTQCGAKLVQAAIVPRLFDEPFSSQWIFDVELLARLRNLVGRDRMRREVIEMPLSTWNGVEGSKLRAGAWLRAPLELLNIARRYN
jgi:dolichyl-phosphate beta-glucosyltransferase